MSDPLRDGSFRDEPDEDDDIIRLDLEDERPPGPSPLSPMEIETLSPEARLATALVMQAQALEGMHQTQADLVQRVGDERDDGGRVEGAMAAVHRRLEDVHESQRGTRSQLRSLRRRAGRLLAVATVLGFGALVVVAWWLAARLDEAREESQGLAQELRSLSTQQTAALQASLGSVQDEDLEELRGMVADLGHRLEDGRDAGRAAELALAGLRAEHEQSRDRVAELDGRIEQLASERDALVSSGQALADELQAARAEAEQALSERSEMRNERNGQLAEMARLRSQLLERELQVQALHETLGGLEQRWAAQARPTLETSTNPPDSSLSEAATAALVASGAERLRVAEVEYVTDGALHGVMLVETDDYGGVARVVPADRGVVTVLAGSARLRLENRAVGGGDGWEWVAEYPLPLLDADAWNAIGVTLPDGVASSVALRTALDELLDPHDYRVVSLGAWRAGRLHDLVIESDDRRIRASNATVDGNGPALELRDGAVLVEGFERPFYNGAMRLSLPGSDYGRWVDALLGSRQ